MPTPSPAPSGHNIPPVTSENKKSLPGRTVGHSRLGAKVKSVRSLPVKAGGKTVAETDAYALEVTTTDGKRQVFFVNYSDGKKTVGPVTTAASVAVWDIGADGKSANFRQAKASR